MTQLYYILIEKDQNHLAVTKKSTKLITLKNPTIKLLPLNLETFNQLHGTLYVCIKSIWLQYILQIFIAPNLIYYFADVLTEYLKVLRSDLETEKHILGSTKSPRNIDVILSEKDLLICWEALAHKRLTCMELITKVANAKMGKYLELHKDIDEGNW